MSAAARRPFAFLAAAMCLSLALPSCTADPPAQDKHGSFAPNLQLKWPDKPAESSQVIDTPAGPQKNYSATLMNRQNRTLYAAFVLEYPEGALKETSPKDLVAAYVLGSKRSETSRKEVAHGKQMCPGLEITTKTERGFSRKLVVIAGSRIYEVSVTSPTEAGLTSAPAKAFLESLAVGD